MIYDICMSTSSECKKALLVDSFRPLECLPENLVFGLLILRLSCQELLLSCCVCVNSVRKQHVDTAIWFGVGLGQTRGKRQSILNCAHVLEKQSNHHLMPSQNPFPGRLNSLVS